MFPRKLNMKRPPIRRKIAVSAIKRKGFTARKRRSSTAHEIYILKDEDGRNTGRTIKMVNPHSGRQGMVTEKIVKQWSLALNINNRDWVYEFIDCTKSHQDLLNFLRERGYIN